MKPTSPFPDAVQHKFISNQPRLTQLKLNHNKKIEKRHKYARKKAHDTAQQGLGKRITVDIK